MGHVSEAVPTGANGRYATPVDLSKFAVLSIGAALVTIVLKTASWWVTGSVGLLADAAESLVNLVAALVAFVALKVSIKPADENHPYGHSKAEYFSAVGMCLRVDVTTGVFDPSVPDNMPAFDVTDALKVGADGVVIMNFPGAHNERSTNEFAARLAQQCDAWNVPFMCESLPR